MKTIRDKKDDGDILDEAFQTGLRDHSGSPPNMGNGLDTIWL